MVAEESLEIELAETKCRRRDLWRVQRERLDNFWVLLGALFELLQRQLVVSILFDESVR